MPLNSWKLEPRVMKADVVEKKAERSVVRKSKESMLMIVLVVFVD